LKEEINGKVKSVGEGWKLLEPLQSSESMANWDSHTILS